MQNDLVSILIPTYKRPQLLREAISSALNQTEYPNIEVIVSDNDPSLDHAMSDLILSFGDSRLSYHKNAQNLGMTGNWNKCIELANGNYITILHDDDILYPNFLTTCAPLLRDYDLVLCKVRVGMKPPSLDELSRICFNQKPQQKRQIVKPSDLVFGNFTPFPGVIFKKDKALELCGFDDSWYPCSDYDFWIRYCLNYRVVKLPIEAAFYRISQNESQKIETKIQMAEKAYCLQQNLVSLLFSKSKIWNSVPKVAIEYLLAHYCLSPEFKSSSEYRNFCKKHKLHQNRQVRVAKILYKKARLMTGIRNCLATALSVIRKNTDSITRL